MRYFLIAFIGLWLTACQLPSEHVVIGENTAGISFKLTNPDRGKNYQVYVDGLLMGNASDFMEGKALLKILPGSHIIKLMHNNKIVFQEKLYVASGANKTMVVK